MFTEKNNKLTQKEIWDNQQTPVNSSSLVLNLRLIKGLILTGGDSLIFVYHVWNIDFMLYSTAEIELFITNSQIIIDKSFVVDLNCSNVVYNSFKDSLTTLYNLKISSDGSNLPLYHGLTYEQNFKL